MPILIKLEGNEDSSQAETDLTINVRDAFTAKEGYKKLLLILSLDCRFSFLAFDYSQIEMRILAHMSQVYFFMDYKQKKG